MHCAIKGSYRERLLSAVKETNVWVHKLEAIHPTYPKLVHAPIKCPLFAKAGDCWIPVEGTLPP